MRSTFSILMPVVRRPLFMPYSIASVLAQTRKDFELCIVCDGAPWETIAFAEEASRRDPRVKVFPFPKGERNGETHRHSVLQQARSDFVCQIADDDLWFPNHLEEAARFLADYEFGNLLHVAVLSEGRISYPTGDLSDPRAIKGMMAGVQNLFGPTASAYRLETYRRLPIGWSPAPEGIWSDLHMWRKFLSLPNIKAGTRYVLTSLHLLTEFRQGRTDAERVDEMKRYAQIVGSEAERDSLEQDVFHRWAKKTVHHMQRAEDLKTRCLKLEAMLERSQTTAAAIRPK